MIANSLTEHNADSATAGPRRQQLWIRAAVIVAVTVLLSAAAMGIRTRLTSATSDDPHRAVPVSAALQQRLGVRFSRVAVVADGGLITLSYVVLDAEKATQFQSDQAHPPVLTSESRKLSTSKVSLMKQGHVLSPGQTYYLVFANTRDALRPGEQVTITDQEFTLAHFPVL